MIGNIASLHPWEGRNRILQLLSSAYPNGNYSANGNHLTVEEIHYISTFVSNQLLWRFLVVSHHQNSKATVSPRYFPVSFQQRKTLDNLHCLSRYSPAREAKILSAAFWIGWKLHSIFLNFVHFATKRRAKQIGISDASFPFPVTLSVVNRCCL